jgi:hypothetical protein
MKIQLPVFDSWSILLSGKNIKFSTKLKKAMTPATMHGSAKGY